MGVEATTHHHPTGEMIRIEQSEEEINSKGGIIAVAAMLEETAVWKKISAIRGGRTQKGHNTHGEILKIAVSLMALGHREYEAIKLYHNDELFKEALGLKKIPSVETFRQRLDELGKNPLVRKLMDEISGELLSRVKDFGEVKTSSGNYIPMDIDVSVMLEENNKKEGVGFTYHKKNGYAPIYCHIGAEGYMLANQLRPGEQHSAKEAVEFFEHCIKQAKQVGIAKEKLLLRTDSGHDDKAFIGALCKAEIAFLVKRNLRRERLEGYWEIARSTGQELPSTRKGKEVWRTIVSHRKPGGLENETIFMVIEATQRKIKANGQILLIPEIEVDTYWTNLPQDEATCIALYQDRGTSEQFHSELKYDMGLDHLPSGKFSTNALYLHLATLSFNSLRFIGQQAMLARESIPVKIKSSRLRLKSVLRDLIYIGCKLTRHAREVIIKFGRNCPWFACFQAAYRAACARC